ncbi:MAG: TraR/DksA C4-type zinc finger protein [Rhodospirillaceae bacterium]
MTENPTEPRGRLDARRQELLSLIEAASDSAAPVTLDPQVQGRLSRMDAMQGQAMSQAANERRRAEIARIDSALRRLADGEYGYCVICGEEIAEKRLRHDPAAARCIDCAG